MIRIMTFLAILAALPLAVKDEGAIYFMTLIMIWCIFALGYDLVFGVTGLLSFGHAAFFGAGSYVFALLMMVDASWFPLAMLAAALVGALLALAVSAVALRLSGIYFSLMTLACAELLFFAASSPLRAYTGGEDGLAGVPRPEFLGIDFYDGYSFYLLVFAFFALTLLCSRLLRGSPFGKVLSGIKVNEIRADQVGFNVKRLKLSAFAISGAFSGVAGALLGSLMQFVNPQSFHWSTSGDVVIMSLLGGVGTLFGPIIGVLVFETLKEVVSSYTVHWYGILGLIFIVATMYMPTGVHGALLTLKTRVVGRRA